MSSCSKRKGEADEWLMKIFEQNLLMKTIFEWMNGQLKKNFERLAVMCRVFLISMSLSKFTA